MRRGDVEIQGRYIAKVSGRRAVVRITGKSRYGWDATEEDTGRTIRIRSAALLSKLGNDQAVEATSWRPFANVDRDRVRYEGERRVLLIRVREAVRRKKGRKRKIRLAHRAELLARSGGTETDGEQSPRNVTSDR